jgi:hypothetical protein
MSSNVPLGTHFEDGLRTGPIYTGTVSPALLTFNPTEVLSYSAYTAYGPGILQSPQNTWSITPYPASVSNLVASTAAAAVTGPMNLTLTGDNAATRYVGGAVPYVQFDWPRVVTVTTVGGGNAAVSVTIFGSDWYGVPMQQTYIIPQNTEATSPLVNYGVNASITPNAKAFYTVERVWISGALTGGSISLGVADVFGLPYFVEDEGDITSIGWSNSSEIALPSSLGPINGEATFAATQNVVVYNQSVKENSVIQLTINGVSSLGSLRIYNVTPGQSFTITSTNNVETATVDWTLINPDGQYVATTGGAGAQPMSGGVLAYSTTNFPASSIVHASRKALGGTLGSLFVTSMGSTPTGYGFNVNSSDNADTSTPQWFVTPQNWVSGTAKLTAGGTLSSAFVKAPSVTANSNIMLTYAGAPINPGVLYAPSASIIPGVGFVINSRNAADVSTVNWTIAQLPTYSGATSAQGGATLVGGSVTISTPGTLAGSTVLVTYNTVNGAALLSPLIATATNANQIVITTTNALDVSTVYYQVITPNATIRNLSTPLGAFIPGDQTSPPTAYTSDVRGLYAPSTPSNGSNKLRFTSYVSGADTWTNQVAAAQSEQTLNSTIPVTGVPVKPLNASDLYGLPQFYTGNPS